MLNYKVFFVPTVTDEEHKATLTAMGYTFRDVVGSEALIDLIGRNQISARRRHAAVA